jgi:hypothetical protein
VLARLVATETLGKAGLANTFGNRWPRLSFNELKGAVAPNAETAIQKMSAVQEGQHWRTAAGKLVEHAIDASIALGISGGHQKSFDGVLFAAGGNIYFREI